ncbi:MAG: NTP transferase domain-containing protein [Bacteroidales bacterium]|nr:NTP transferase domain-containing protein [Candidatus Latescibacterota bacterium]
MSGNNGLAAVILAAGQGTRMKSDMAKVLHQLCGRPMIRYVVDAAGSIDPERIILVVGYQAEAVMKEMDGEDVEFALQEERLGTGHAVLQAGSLLEGFSGTVMVLTGDTPLLRSVTLAALLETHRDSCASATVLSAVLEDATGYGRIIKDKQGQFLKIVEHKDASDDEKKVNEINSGIFCFESRDLFSALAGVGKENAQGEYYLTDVMSILREEGRKTVVHLCLDRQEVMGINDVDQLKEAERLMN